MTVKPRDVTGATTAPQQGEGGVSALKPGQQFDRFVVLEQLGEGGMGVVYEVYDRKLDRRIALKVIRSSRTEDDAAIARFMREAQALARLSHPNVVHVYDVGTVESSSFIAMEL